MKTCAFCAKPIQDVAVDCIHCGEAWGRPTPVVVRPTRLAILVAALLVMFIGSGWWLRQARVHRSAADQPPTPVARM
jgi:hypothetical protein